MSEALPGFLDDYTEALRRHLDSPTHDTLTEGYDLGRRALVEGISLLDLTEHHFRLAAEAERAAADPRVAETALEFLLQTLAALDIATRGYLDGTRRYEQQRSRADDLAGRDAFRTALVESLQDGFFVADATGAIIEVNSAFGALTGYGAAGLPYPLPHPWSLPDGPRYPDLGTEASRFVLPIRHRDGRRLWLAVSTSALVKPENNELVYVGTIRDVTAEHDAQARDQAASRLATAVGAATTVVEVLSVGLDELRGTVGAEAAVVMVWPTRNGAPEVYVSGEAGADAADDTTRRLLDRARRRPPRSLSAIPEQADSSEGIVAPLGETGDAALWLRFAAPRAISSADWTLFSLLIGHLSVAVQRARNFDQARATSLTLQRAMLGPIELPPRFSVHYEPALPPLEIGGDWYDVVPLRDGTIGVVVGDCVGRGLSAAVVMGQLRTAGRALLLRGAGPAQLLAELDTVAARIPGAMCTTACVAVLDPVRGIVRYSSAGHMPPILAEVGKPGRLLEGGRSVPLATFEMPRRPEATTALAPGSTLVLFTDGLVEQRGVDIDEGFAKICAVLADTGGRLPREVADAVLRELSPAAGYDDDVAMVVYRQPPAPLHLRVPAEATRLSALRRTLQAWFSAAAVPHDLAADLVAAANEACSNSIEHAYRAAAHSGEMVDLAARIELDPDGDTERLVIEVVDTGTWQPRSPDPGYRGRGLDMMRALTEELDIDHSGPGTRVRMSVTLPAIKSPVANPLRGTQRRSG
ncbi:SpoIIE family protein phosphatase [Nocardia farcinica]|uniref:SpoIIE family protein phosphatase n=1 Tax=Nocardia farcinica TaxID=37329 RepID=UPI000BF44FD5|nr:SpoIIE family protein phosphatase [Nocardia farcinica]MBF6257346.1 SpoIIE family protein phosphatase [Nocardia farcinica]MBF6383670.1 SpoIIE family protein phosphatase [Nocardia farcinica]MBF6443254.1 SpoIIE family protein phosphatase [Nocardia farcinica]MBF6537272.1 SpoIIE family protein phosphatase [Nocardia farcinica]PFX03403.1 Phosphoserine phosphatase RsbU [Nocardia farcinica]